MKLKNKKTRYGFTLVEVMVVVVILGILAGVVVVNISDNADRAKVEAARSQVKTFEQVLLLFKLDNDKYPTTSEGLAILLQPSEKAGKTEGYLSSKKIPKDPWGNDYVYICPGQDGSPFTVMSYGRNGRPGGSGLDSDLSNGATND